MSGNLKIRYITKLRVTVIILKQFKSKNLSKIGVVSHDVGVAEAKVGGAAASSTE